MPLIAEILALLRKSPVRNANPIDFIEDYPPQSVLQAGDSVLVRGTSDKPWVYIGSSSLSWGLSRSTGCTGLSWLNHGENTRQPKELP